MDKNTLSKFGWIIITAIVVAIIITGSTVTGEMMTDSLIGNIEKNIVSYSVVLDPNGGTVAFNDLIVVPGKEYGYMPIPVLDGKLFDGWYTSPYGGEKITSQTVYNGSSNHTLYARWK